MAQQENEVNMSVAYSEKGNQVQKHIIGSKSRRGGPLVHKNDMFPSLERSAKNQSELSLLKLPDIA